MSATIPRAYNKGALFCTLVTDDSKVKEWTYQLHFESIPRVVVSPSSFNLGMFKASDFDATGVLKKGAGCEPAVFRLDLFSIGKDTENHGPVLSGGEGLSAALAPGPAEEEIGNGIWHRRYVLTVFCDGLRACDYRESSPDYRREDVRRGPGGSARFVAHRTLHGRHATIASLRRVDGRREEARHNIWFSGPGKAGPFVSSR